MAEHHYHIWLLDPTARHGRRAGDTYRTHANARYHADKIRGRLPHGQELYIIRCANPDCPPIPDKSRHYRYTDAERRETNTLRKREQRARQRELRAAHGGRVCDSWQPGAAITPDDRCGAATDCPAGHCLRVAYPAVDPPRWCSFANDYCPRPDQRCPDHYCLLERYPRTAESIIGNLAAPQDANVTPVPDSELPF